MTHFYISKKFLPDNQTEVKILCTKEWAVRDPSRRDATTVPEGVTCEYCLGLLLPRQEMKLAQMRRNLAEAIARKTLSS